jgi:enterochelin esterase-like enzyme
MNPQQAAAYRRENAAIPVGKTITFSMSSADSKIYPGIARVGALGTIDPNNVYTLLVPNSQPTPYNRTVNVYVPAGYVPGTPMPVMVGMDGMGYIQTAVLDNLIAQKRIPAMIAVGLPSGGGDAQGSQRGLEYDTMSGKFAEFVETEVFPLVEKNANVVITKDPEGRATIGGSSGASAALIMAWYRPDLFRRVISYSGTFVNQQWPFNPETPHGAWGFHESIIAESEVKPIRLWMQVSDGDLLNPNVMRDNMHDWVAANNRMAMVLRNKGYHYQYSYSLNSGHTTGPARDQTYALAYEWVWQGYQPKAAAPAKQP